jgi:hypothetical protein
MRRAILPIVGLLQPVALWIVFHDWPSAIAPEILEPIRRESADRREQGWCFLPPRLYQTSSYGFGGYLYFAAETHRLPLFD